jgi:uncharacterized SAM-binding protein YcdF (DUF218 family)
LRVLNSAWCRRTLALAVGCALAVAGAYAAREPLLRALGHQLVHADVPVPSDAIVMLSGGYFDRELEAADLYLRGLAPLVVMTRQAETPVVEALRARGVRIEPGFDVGRRVLIELGVPPGSIDVLDGLMASTHQEAEALREWAAHRGVRSLIVVTSSFHTARARYVFRLVFGDAPVRLQFVPASASGFEPDTWWMDRVTLRQGLIEWQKMLFYRAWY